MKLSRSISDFWQYVERHSFIIFLLLCKYRFRHWTGDDIKRYQESRIRNRVRMVLSKSDFYRHHYEGYDISDIWNLPVTNKGLMMENLSSFNTVGLDRKEILEFCLENESKRDFTRRLRGINIGMSSGTSGNKGVEMTSVSEENILRAGFFARFDFPKKQKINLAFILRVTSPAFSLNKFGHRLTYVSQMDSIENIVKKMNDQKPNVISAPPSMLKLIASEAENNRLNIKPVKVISYAEVLYPDVKEYLIKTFGCEVHEIYKCSEGAIAITCRYGNLHVNEDIVAIQPLDLNGNPSKPGEPCHKLVITDLHKSTLPIIRYELNDIITIGTGKCRCGSNFRIIDRIIGRADDMLWGVRKRDNSKHFIFQDYITRAIISVSDDILEFQVVQKDLEHLVVRIMLRDGTALSGISYVLRSRIRKVFSDYECFEPDIEVLLEEPVANLSSGKLSRVICEIKDI